MWKITVKSEQQRGLEMRAVNWVMTLKRNLEILDRSVGMFFDENNNKL